MMMHGLTDPKFINAKQEGDTYAYRNIKPKLHITTVNQRRLLQVISS
jgi:hypothetical protein